MTEHAFFDALLYSWYAVSLVVMIALQFIRAPFGRHTRRGWGPEIPNRAGWVMMELPALFTMPAFFFLSGRRDPASIAFVSFWLLHYVNRALIYPLRTRTRRKRMPLVIALLAAATNVCVGYLLGRGLFFFAEPPGAAWLTDPRFVLGTLLFVAGFALNNHADHVLMNLRKPGQREYVLPRGGLFEWVSCPNFLGEIVEWTGFAILTWSLPAVAFLCWTISNLVPRGQAHHAWYRETFADYPARRRAVLPFLL